MPFSRKILVFIILVLSSFSMLHGEKLNLPKIKKLRSFDTKINLLDGGAVIVTPQDGANNVAIDVAPHCFWLRPHGRFVRYC